jgi:hypothetical protein
MSGIVPPGCGPHGAAADRVPPMAAITVTPRGPGRFDVVVAGETSSSTHSVTIATDAVDRLAPGSTPEALVEASFRFLLEREPKESILAAFDLDVIARYFPEFPDRIGDLL